MTFIKSKVAISALLAAALYVIPALAADPVTDAGGKVKRESSAEMHDKMAQLHKNMSECLKSDKPMDVCKRDMMKECRDITKGGKCPVSEQMAGEAGRSSKSGMSHY